MSAATPGEPVLVSHAQNLAQLQGQPFDSLHVVAMALLRPELAGAVGQTLVQSVTPPQRDQWLQFLNAALRAGGQQPLYPGGPTNRLAECRRIWTEMAQRFNGLSEALVFVTIVRYDGVTAEMMRQCGINAGTLTSNLEAQLGQPVGAPSAWATQAAPWGIQQGPTSGSLGGNWAGIQAGPWQAPQPIPAAGGQVPAWPPRQDPTDAYRNQWTGPTGAMVRAPAAEDQPAAKEAMRLIKRVPTRQGLMYPRMFSAHMIHFLDVLADSALNSIFVVLSGMNGSPATRFGEILAGRIAMGERFDGHQAPLANCRDVVVIDIRTLNTSMLPGGLDPARVLTMALEAVAAANAILMVEHMEALDGNQSPAPELRNVLMRRGQALAFGLYWTTDNADPHLERSLGMPSAVPIHTAASTPQETGTLINQVYAPYWAGQSRVAVAPEIPGVFADIYALEPGAYINRQRMTLPFLAVEVAEDAIQLATRGGEQAIGETVQGALAQITQLRDDRKVPEPIKRRFERPLAEAEREIRSLSKPPRIHADQNGLLRLTRAHVTAQLIDWNDSYFAYPPQP